MRTNGPGWPQSSSSWWLWGDSSVGFHVAVVALHLAVAGLLAVLTARLSKQPAMGFGETG